MKWFGESWGAPACDPDEHVPTPAGAICLHCDEVIEPGDAGFILPLVTSPATVEAHAWHLECLMGRVLPSGVDGAKRALAVALRIAKDPTNRLVACSCGVSFLSAAASKDPMGRPMCIGCGAAQELPP